MINFEDSVSLVHENELIFLVQLSTIGKRGGGGWRMWLVMNDF